MSAKVTLDDLKWLAEDSRRKRYTEGLIFGLASTPGETIVLRETEELPQAGDIPLNETPTFRELTDYLRAYTDSHEKVANGRFRFEIFCGGYPFVVHAMMTGSDGNRSLSLRVEPDPSDQPVPNAAGFEPVKITWPTAEQLIEYNRRPLVTPTEYKRRVRESRWPPLLWFGLVVLALAGLLIACFRLTGLLPSPFDDILFLAALVVLPVALGYPLLKYKSAYDRKHGLSCPYCHKSLGNDWMTYRQHNRAKARQSRLQADILAKNSFITGLCKHCKAEIIDPQTDDGRVSPFPG